MRKIKNLLFDLGDIFLTIEYQKTVEAFTNLGVINFPEFYSPTHDSSLFDLLETGKIEPDDFFKLLRKEAHISASDYEIKSAWNAMLIDFPDERIDWLSNIKLKYKVYLFSNTNIIHYNAFSEIFANHNRPYKFDDLFIKAYYSHELGLRKPFAESYLKILREQHIKPEETLFIDDILKNIDGAKAVGLQTEHLQFPKTVLDLNL